MNAAAIYEAGRSILRRGRDDARVVELYREAAQCLWELERHGEQLSGAERFLQDRLIADTQLSLRGWLRDEHLGCEEKAILARNLVRVAIASGSVRWRAHDDRLPNLMGATHVFFGEDRPQIYERAALLAPAIYLVTAAAWRPFPAGYVEVTLARLLDSGRWDGTLPDLGPAHQERSLVWFLSLASQYLN